MLSKTRLDAKHFSAVEEWWLLGNPDVILMALRPLFRTMHMRMARTICCLLLILSAVAIRTAGGADQPATTPVAVAATDPNGVEFFEENIRPVLAENCYSCHSAEAIKVKGQLRLDSRQGIAKGGEGGPILVAGQPEKSRLIEAIRWMNPAFQMPPKKKLNPEQIEKFEQWVTMGAPRPAGSRYWARRRDEAADCGGGSPHVVGVEAD